MRFKIDENLPVEAAELFTGAGHDAMTILDQSMGGRPDPDVAAVCQQEQRALVALDLDFSDIRTYPPQDYYGIIVLRLHQQDKATVLNLMTRLLPSLPQETLEKHLWIVEESAIRIRAGS